MIYFDNAATALPRADSVKRALCYAVDHFGNPGRTAFGQSKEAHDAVFSAREAVAELFCAGSALNVAFTHNCTLALNMALNSVYRPGMKVVVDCAAHNSALRPIYALSQGRPDMTVIGLDASFGIDSEALLREVASADLCVLSHASNLCGGLLDMEKIGAACAKSGAVLVVDAAQSAGHADIDMAAMDIDILCFSGHKGLRATQGSGGLCVRPGKGFALKPLISGGSGTNTFAHEHPGDMPQVFEAGTMDTHSIHALDAAIREHKNTAQKRAAADSKLRQMFIDGVKHIPNVKLYAAAEPCVPVLAFNILDYSSQAVAERLYDNWGIVSRAGAHCAPLMHRALGTEKQGAVRFSFSADNTEAEIETALRAVSELAVI